MIQAFAFYLFATVVIASGVMTIASRNPVHSVLWLILAFFNAAVLFLFVVMMLDVDFAQLRAGFARYLPFGALLALVLLAEIVFAVAAWNAGGIDLGVKAAPVDPNVPNIQALGTVLYTRYLYIFEAAGLVLLVAMIGAIVLTHRTRSNVRPQNVSKQNQRRPQDAVRIVTDQAVGEGVRL
jgi:NADH-quinone oxidoreductase subunit J